MSNLSKIVQLLNPTLKVRRDQPCVKTGSMSNQWKSEFID
jgi:hypothetical protein